MHACMYTFAPGGIDRAAKSGFLNSLRILVEHGATAKGVSRFNGETPVGTACMHTSKVCTHAK